MALPRFPADVISVIGEKLLPLGKTPEERWEKLKAFESLCRIDKKRRKACQQDALWNALLKLYHKDAPASPKLSKKELYALLTFYDVAGPAKTMRIALQKGWKNWSDYLWELTRHPKYIAQRLRLTDDDLRLTDDDFAIGPYLADPERLVRYYRLLENYVAQKGRVSEEELVALMRELDRDGTNSDPLGILHDLEALDLLRPALNACHCAFGFLEDAVRLRDPELVRLFLRNHQYRQDELESAERTARFYPEIREILEMHRPSGSDGKEEQLEEEESSEDLF